MVSRSFQPSRLALSCHVSGSLDNKFRKNYSSFHAGRRFIYALSGDAIKALFSCHFKYLLPSPATQTFLWQRRAALKRAGYSFL